MQIARAAEKEMVKNKLVGLGKTYAPTLYTVLLSPADDENLNGFYPTLSSEFGTFLVGKASEEDLFLTTKPFVRFMVDDDLSTGKFTVIAESVSEDELAQIRAEEEEYWYGEGGQEARPRTAPAQGYASAQSPYEPAPFTPEPPAPVVPPVGEPGAFVPSSVPVKDPFEFGSRPISQPQTPPHQEVPPQPAPAPVPQAQTQKMASLLDLKSGRVIPLTKQRILIGRESTCDVAIEDVNVSRNHAEIIFEGGGWILRDLGSTNGSIVNDQKVTSHRLSGGDSLTFGVSRFEFQER